MGKIKSAKNRARQKVQEKRELIDSWNLCFRRGRGQVLKPLLFILDKLGLTANIITNFRLIASIIFLFWFYYQPYPASFFIAFVFTLDIIDGALARYQNTSSDRGKFLDIFVDRMLHITVILALLINPGQNIKLLAYNLAIVPTVYLLATLKKGEGRPSDWIIQPYPRTTWTSMWPMFAFFIYFWLGQDLLEYSLWISNTLSTIMGAYYFIMVQVQWKKLYGKPNKHT